MNERLPEKILVQLPSGRKLEATLLNWPVDGHPVYSVPIEEMIRSLKEDAYEHQTTETN